MYFMPSSHSLVHSFTKTYLGVIAASREILFMGEILYGEWDDRNKMDIDRILLQFGPEAFVVSKHMIFRRADI